MEISFNEDGSKAGLKAEVAKDDDTTTTISETASSVDDKATDVNETPGVEASGTKQDFTEVRKASETN